MTLEEAVAILNERNHRGGGWGYSSAAPEKLSVTGPDYETDWLDPFEAIAIAEKYAAGGSPEQSRAEVIANPPHQEPYVPDPAQQAQARDMLQCLTRGYPSGARVIMSGDSRTGQQEPSDA